MVFMVKHSRFGFHYFPDTLHYRQSDLEIWLPELTGLGVSWLALQSPLERAIPEYFLAGLVAAGIQPLLNFHLPLGAPVDSDALHLLFRSYSSWGARHVVLFDRPNLRSAWPAPAWMQIDLVERFLDLFLPAAELAIAHDLTPLFPPLLPGGDYWDLAFLRVALRSLKRRQSERWLEKLALAAYAGSGDRPLDWGAGGAQRWPGARPYPVESHSLHGELDRSSGLDRTGMQDQRGLHIYEWYLPVCQEELGFSLPLYLLGLGSYPGDAPHTRTVKTLTTEEENTHARRNLDILACLGTAGDGASSEILPGEVKAGCFWLLAAGQESDCEALGWYEVKPDGLQPRSAASLARRWVHRSEVIEPDSIPKSIPVSEPPTSHTIAHYILLPLYAWGVAQWDLARIAPLLEQSHPTVGFSLEEASLAARVTVVGGSGAFSSQALEFLRKAGCIVEYLDDEAGTLVATTGERCSGPPITEEEVR